MGEASKFSALMNEGCSLLQASHSQGKNLQARVDEFIGG
jgi:hypothetical protein